MQNPITLTDVAEKFSLWREERPGKRQHTPEHLRKLAVLLLNEYPISVVVNTLNTSHARLNRWRNEFKGSEDTPQVVSSDDFIELAQPKLPEMPPIMSLTIDYPSGVRLKLEGSPEDSILHMLLTSLETAGRYV